MVCYDLLVDIKLRKFCHNCKFISYCDEHAPGYCDYCIGRVAKELGMEFMDVAGVIPPLPKEIKEAYERLTNK